jgi:hypothetical protein
MDSTDTEPDDDCQRSVAHRIAGSAELESRLRRSKNRSTTGIRAGGSDVLLSESISSSAAQGQTSFRKTVWFCNSIAGIPKIPAAPPAFSRMPKSVKGPDVSSPCSKFECLKRRYASARTG